MKKNGLKFLSVILCISLLVGSMILPSSVITTTATTEIPSDAVQFGNSCYKVIDESMTWTEAKAYCEEQGGHLATITSQEEQDFLTELAASSSKNNLWLGGETSDEGSFYWITGESFEYTNWGYGEPNNTDGYEYKIMMHAKEYKYHAAGVWNDEDNTASTIEEGWYHLSKFGFICEWETPSYTTIEQYMANVILDNNYSGYLNNYNGSTPQNYLYNYLLNPELVSLSRIHVDLLQENTQFQSSVVGWKTLSFSPDAILEGNMDEIGYYETILINILNSSIDSFVLDSVKKTESTLASITSAVMGVLRTNATIDRDILLSKNWDFFDEDLQLAARNAAIAKCDSLKMTNAYIDDADMIFKTTVSVIEYCEKITNLEEISNLDQYVYAVLEQLDNECPETNLALKAAISEVKAVCKDSFNKTMVEIIDMAAQGTTVVAEEGIKLLWSDAIVAISPSIGTGFLLGQLIGTGLSNFLFSTDSTIEKYYVMESLVEFENTMISQVKQAAKNYLSYESNENAKLFLTSLKMLIGAYSLSADYAGDYVEVTKTEGLLNGIKSIFGFGNEQEFEAYYKTCISQKNNMSVWEDALTNFEFGYSEALAIDNPTLYEEYKTKNTNTNEYWNTKIITVACPTDVEIYANNNRVASIVSNKIIGTAPGVVVFVDGDVKHIVLPADDTYFVEIYGTDRGSMNYTVSSYVNNSYKRETVFKSIPLETGSVYKSSALNNNDDIITLTNENDNVIFPDFDSSDVMFSDASLTCQNDISFEAEERLFSEVGYENPRVVFDCNDGNFIEINDYSVEGDKYVFNYGNIAPDQMCDIVNATLYADFEGATYCSETKKYSLVAEHNMAEANCATPSTCTLCDYAIGEPEPLNHDFSDEWTTDTDGNIKYTCTVCGGVYKMGANGELVNANVSLGDLDGNSSYNAFDAIMLSDSIINCLFGDGEFDPNCDLNGDGVINLIDLVRFKKHLVNKDVYEFTYEIVDETVTITGIEESAEGAITIPFEIEGCPVTQIYESAFINNTKITSILMHPAVVYCSLDIT